MLIVSGLGGIALIGGGAKAKDPSGTAAAFGASGAAFGVGGAGWGILHGAVGGLALVAIP